jgi:hypothetical protein
MLPAIAAAAALSALSSPHPTIPLGMPQPAPLLAAASPPRPSPQAAAPAAAAPATGPLTAPPCPPYSVAGCGPADWNATHYPPLPPPCSCEDRSLCGPLKAPAYGARKEVQAFFNTPGNLADQEWANEVIDSRYVNWDVVTTIYYDTTADKRIVQNLTCEAHKRGVRVLACTPGLVPIDAIY